MRDYPVDVCDYELIHYSITQGTLEERIRDKRPALTVFILDACRSVRVTRSSRDFFGGLLSFEPKQLEDGGVVIAFATAPHKTALDGTLGSSRNGLYTTYLLKH
jgi:hypothetical protein|tara:strand:- start:186 stop:497 length:312 start_codon:yes stop_codon:yes gene_type:complete